MPGDDEKGWSGFTDSTYLLHTKPIIVSPSFSVQRAFARFINRRVFKHTEWEDYDGWLSP